MSQRVLDDVVRNGSIYRLQLLKNTINTILTIDIRKVCMNIFYPNVHSFGDIVVPYHIVSSRFLDCSAPYCSRFRAPTSHTGTWYTYVPGTYIRLPLSLQEIPPPMSLPEG